MFARNLTEMLLLTRAIFHTLSCSTRADN